MSTNTSPNQQDVFIFFAREGIINELKELINGVDINAEDTCNNTTALIEATKHDHAKVVQYLCQYASIQKSSNDSLINNFLNHETPTHEIAILEAAKNNATNIASILLKYGANVNVQTSDDKVTPLHEACRHAFSPMILLLLEAGADASIADAQGNTPVQLVPQDAAHLIESLMDDHAHGTVKDEDLMLVDDDAAPTGGNATQKRGKRRQKSTTRAAANSAATKQANGKQSAPTAGKKRASARGRARNGGISRTRRTHTVTYEDEMQDDDEAVRDEMQIDAEEEPLSTPVRSSRRTSTASNAFNSTTTTRTGVKASKTSSARKHLQRLAREKPKCYKKISSRKLSTEAKEFYSKLTDTFMTFSQTEDEELRDEVAQLLYSEPFLNLYDEIQQCSEQSLIQS
mmetsp:Transcript_842/g.2899  ORF Transcript_842/g.2899 Transcript_842/m.2899 type:complete len:401 (-) Transcript_842:76-1278(-)